MEEKRLDGVRMMGRDISMQVRDSRISILAPAKT